MEKGLFLKMTIQKKMIDNPKHEGFTAKPRLWMKWTM